MSLRLDEQRLFGAAALARMHQDGRDFLHASACFSEPFSAISFQDCRMECGGAWSPNQQAARLPTRASDSVEKPRCDSVERKGQDEAEISVAPDSINKVAVEPFIVNLKNRSCWQCHHYIAQRGIESPIGTEVNPFVAHLAKISRKMAASLC